ncbi:MAG: hypothetical protein II773_13020 [Oscillospiraceae bacterium]|nr:hypothetical protein [Oscillospiraceae bacterium]MBQ4312501.1 hypothetical protein [Oscillospiraceae bacterium]
MQDDTMKACADLILTDAIEDLARDTDRSKEEIRKALMTSKAYECLYDPESGLWQEGPEYFISFYKRIEGIV